MTYDVMTYKGMTYDVITYDIMTYDVMAYDVMPYDIMTYDAMKEQLLLKMITKLEQFEDKENLWKIEHTVQNSIFQDWLINI